jgi:hypothetical protein
MARRRIFVVLSRRSLGYSRLSLESLFRNSLEPMDVHLITDSSADKDALSEEVNKFPTTGQHSWAVYTSDELREREAVAFAPYPNLQQLRNGHPCWRKITDPVLLSEEGEELIMLDPDVYFPNRFRFEQTLDSGLLLMWQKPNCLLPPDLVSRALKAGISLAHHVDIGVAQWRALVELEWLDWLLGRLRAGAPLPYVMHVEAVVWAAIAMRIGGGFLHPRIWHCWRRTQLKRLLHRTGVPGSELLRFEPFATVKCFHAGGMAKYWLEAAKQSGRMDCGNLLDQPSPVVPFVQLTPTRYKREQRLKNMLRKCGYYRVFRSA